MKLGGGGRNRTDEWGFCRALPCHLATPPSERTDCREARHSGASFVRPLGSLLAPNLRHLPARASDEARKKAHDSSRAYCIRVRRSYSAFVLTA